MATGNISLAQAGTGRMGNRFARYAWGVVLYNVAVILWGAYVRATGSGAGCGSHWPLCNGEVIPRSPQMETIIEFTHRITSGLALLLVVGLLVWAWRAYPREHPVWLGARLSMFFMITESLVGASLVLFELVAYNLSFTRAVVMAIHLLNTLFLLAALTLTAWWASGGPRVSLRFTHGRMWLLALALVGTMIVGMTGAITALGDTLFPASSLAEGIQQDFSPTAHFLVRLRVFHPLMAVFVGGVIVLLARKGLRAGVEGPARPLAYALVALVLIQLTAGFVNVLLLAPVWLQIVHLLLADMLWIVLVLYAAWELRAEAV